MKKYSFKEWAEIKMISETVDSEPQQGDLIITNPKAFIDSVISKSGKLKNNGTSELRNFSRFKVNDVNGRKVTGDVHHRTYSGGHVKKFNSFDFLDVTPAFNVQGNKVWLNNAPGRRETAHYINKMYPAWANKMGIEGHGSEMNQDNLSQMDQMSQDDFNPFAMDDQDVMNQNQIQNTVPQQQAQQAPQQASQDQQAAPWQTNNSDTSSQYQMHNREVIPNSSFGFDDNGTTGSTDYNQLPDTQSQDASFDNADANDFSLAASYDPSIMNYKNGFKDSGDIKRYEYYPE